MLLTVLLALQQSGTAPASFPVARVEIVPSAAEVEVGGQVRLAARALDAGGERASREAHLPSDLHFRRGRGDLDSGDRE